MNIYSKIYYSLCQDRSQLLGQWIPGSGLHRHHIIPKHSNGTDDASNLTFLTVREHIIAHFLLWKIHKNPNDLRSMKMLGAHLSVQYRKIIGEWCRDNRIGFHGASREQRIEWNKKSLQSQINQPNSFWYWSTPEGRKKRASMGGKVGGKKQAELKLGYHQPHVQLLAASLGGKSHKGKKCMYLPGDSSFRRIRPEDTKSYLDEGYVFGSPIAPSKGRKLNIPSKRRKKVSDGNIVYESVQDAAMKNNVTPSAIIHRCNSKKSTWSYI